MREESRQIEESLEAMSISGSVVRKLEKLVCGQTFWRAVARNQNRKLSTMLDDSSISDDSSVLKRQDTFTDQCHDRAEYGRALNDKTRPLVNYMYGEGFTQTEIKDAVFGRIIWPDGTFDFDWMRMWFLVACVAVWHVVAVVASALLVAMVVALSGSWLMKSACIGLIVCFAVGSSTFMHSLAIRPALIWDRSKACLQDRRT